MSCALLDCIKIYPLNSTKCLTLLATEAWSGEMEPSVCDWEQSFFLFQGLRNLKFAILRRKEVNGLAFILPPPQ